MHFQNYKIIKPFTHDRCFCSLAVINIIKADKMKKYTSIVLQEEIDMIYNANYWAVILYSEIKGVLY